jgi:hypothetical protein
MGNKSPFKESSCISGAQSNCDKKWLLGLIGKTLRADYDTVMQEPLPDRLTDLIRRLDEQQRSSTSRPKPASKPRRA